MSQAEPHWRSASHCAAEGFAGLVRPTSLIGIAAEYGQRPMSILAVVPTDGNSAYGKRNVIGCKGITGGVIDMAINQNINGIICRPNGRQCVDAGTTRGCRRYNLA